MHGQTFWRMQARHDAHVVRALGGMWEKMTKTVATLDRINEARATL